MKIQILGTGCAQSRQLAEAARQAAQELRLRFILVEIETLDEIMKFGVRTTPALAIDGRVRVEGKVPSVAELKILLQR